MNEPLQNYVHNPEDSQYMHVSLCWQLYQTTAIELQSDDLNDEVPFNTDPKIAMIEANRTDIQDTCPICLDPFVDDSRNLDPGNPAIILVHDSQ